MFVWYLSQFYMNCCIFITHFDQKNCCNIKISVVSYSKCSVMIKSWVSYMILIFKNFKSDIQNLFLKRSLSCSFNAYFDINIFIFRLDEKWQCFSYTVIINFFKTLSCFLISFHNYSNMNSFIEKKFDSNSNFVFENVFENLL